MPASIPSISVAVRIVYQDLVAIVRDLTAVAIVAVVIMIATNLPARLAFASLASPRAGSLAVFVCGLVQVFLLTPAYIAIHRFIVLGETGARYVLTPGELRFQRYFLLWAAFSTVAVAPSMVSDDMVTSVAGIVSVIVWIGVVMVAGLWLTILFPAIAVDAPGATIANAVADCRGHAWRLLVIGVVTVLPLLVVNMAVAQLSAAASGTPARRLLAELLSSTIDTAVSILFLVIASRFYQWIGDRVRGSS